MGRRASGAVSILDYLEAFEGPRSAELFLTYYSVAADKSLELSHTSGKQVSLSSKGESARLEQLEALVHAPAPTDFASDIWCILPEKRHRGGFYELFALLLVDFHVVETSLKDVVASFSGRTINGVPPFDRLHPTAERIAEHLQARYYANFAMVCYLAEVEVLRPEKF